MSIDTPTRILDLPEGRIYQHEMFNSYTMFDHRSTLQKLDKVGHVVAKLTERITILEDQLEPTATEEQTSGAGTGDNTPETRTGSSGGSSGSSGESSKNSGGSGTKDNTTREPAVKAKSGSQTTTKGNT